jgi:hypothetical protein
MKVIIADAILDPPQEGVAWQVETAFLTALRTYKGNEAKVA